MLVNRRHRCRQCGAHEDDGYRISSRGLCERCGQANYDQAQAEIAARQGPTYNLWAKRTSQAAAQMAADYAKRTAQPQQG